MQAQSSSMLLRYPASAGEVTRLTAVVEAELAVRRPVNAGFGVAQKEASATWGPSPNGSAAGGALSSMARMLAYLQTQRVLNCGGAGGGINAGMPV